MVFKEIRRETKKGHPNSDTFSFLEKIQLSDDPLLKDYFITQNREHDMGGLLIKADAFITHMV